MSRYRIRHYGPWRNREYCVEYQGSIIYKGTWRNCINRLRQVW